MTILMLILSLIALIWSADQLVTGASGLSLYFRVPPFLVGLSIVALATSMPQLISGALAVFDGQDDLAMGNAIGSSIANIGLVLGITALIKPIHTHSTILKREYPTLFLFMLFAYTLMLDGTIGLMDACLFLLACIIVIGYFIFDHQYKHPLPQLSHHFKHSDFAKSSLRGYVINLVSGIIVLLLSTRLFLPCCAKLGQLLHLSDLVTRLTIIAIATSLPGLLTSIIATLKGADDIALGNILGSNILNLIFIMFFPSLIHPTTVSHILLWRDIPMMLGITFILYWITSKDKKGLTRWEACILLLVYLCYIAMLIINAF